MKKLGMSTNLPLDRLVDSLKIDLSSTTVERRRMKGLFNRVTDFDWYGLYNALDDEIGDRNK